MTRMRHWLNSERGFTLAELLIVTAVLGIVMAGVFVIQQQGQQAYLLGSNRVETQQNARIALDLMTRELRSSQVVTPANASDVTFVDQNGKTIRYWLSGTTLNRTENGTTTALIGGVQTLTIGYCSDYNGSTNTCTTTNNASNASANPVKVIKISVLTKTEEGAAAGQPGDQHAKMESTVELRTPLP